MNLRSFLTCILLALTGQALFAQAPTITSFMPSAGPVGTVVTITGTNLGNPTAFTIGGVAAIAVSNSGTQLVGMIMPGAATGTVAVTNSGGTTTGGSNFTITTTPFPAVQQGSELIGAFPRGETPEEGFCIAISGDGNTAAIGAHADTGAVWIYTRSAGIWTQRGTKIIVNDVATPGDTAGTSSLALSADGNTLLIGKAAANSDLGAVWVYTRTGNVWTQTSKLVGAGANASGGGCQ